jgi:murein DD-endopeptidase MepM/ murein hydrolase activator NlpD
MRFHPILHIWKLHDGTDFGAGCGTPIHAAASGVVTDKYYNGGYGNRLFVSHGVIDGSSITTVYNHLSKYNVRNGQRVRKGQVIGYVGTTGYSTGCHLHFMVYQDGRVVNPMKWL